MAKKGLINKSLEIPKFPVRQHNRCVSCFFSGKSLNSFNPVWIVDREQASNFEI